VRALAILGVETGTLWVFITGVGTVVEAINVMVLPIVGKVSIPPHLDPTARALARQFVIPSRC
jgi:hypothetical protein